jgi:(+)-trans-carveol dehydrogenase
VTRVRDKVALVTGAARGQGRSHAVRLAEEGADIIALDLCGDIDTVPYGLGTTEDLEETVRLIEKTGRRAYHTEVDVRDYDRLGAAIGEGVEKLGGLDIAVANAGIMSFGSPTELSPAVWKDMIDVNLTGVWYTASIASSHILKQGRGGSVVLTSSAMGLRPAANLSHYTAAKHGVIGIMRNLATELATSRVRVNAVLPTCVDTDMIHNTACYDLFGSDLSESERTKEILAPRFASLNPMEVPWIDARDVSNAVLWLSSDEARFVTGVALPIDGGQTAR